MKTIKRWWSGCGCRRRRLHELKRENMMLRLELECVRMQLEACEQRELAGREWVQAFNATARSEFALQSTAAELMNKKGA